MKAQIALMVALAFFAGVGNAQHVVKIDTHLTPKQASVPLELANPQPSVTFEITAPAATLDFVIVDSMAGENPVAFVADAPAVGSYETEFGLRNLDSEYRIFSRGDTQYYLPGKWKPIPTATCNDNVSQLYAQAVRNKDSLQRTNDSLRGKLSKLEASNKPAPPQSDHPETNAADVFWVATLAVGWLITPAFKV